jgi:hypothetical protein
MTGRIAILLIVTLNLGCRDPDAVSQRSSVRDSAGVRIVESNAAEWTPETAWRLDSSPLLRIGTGIDGDPDLQFGYISGVHRLPNGSIAVMDAWAPALTFFTETGKVLGRIGREGSGPGEFPARSAPRSFTCGADSVYVSTPPNVHVFTPPGTFVRTFTLDSRAWLKSCYAGRIVAQLGHGEWRGTAGVFTDSAVFALYDLAGQQVAIIDTLPADERMWTRNVEGYGYSRRVFGNTISMSGSGDRLVIGYSDAFHVALFDAEGALRERFHAPSLEQRVTAQDINDYRAFVEPLELNDEEHRMVEDQLKSAAERLLPAFGQLAIDAGGNVWARMYDHLDAVAFFDHSSFSRASMRPTLQGSRRWRVIEGTGQYLGEVTTPDGFEVSEIGRDWVLGIWRDDLDVQFIHVYKLVKPEQEAEAQ